MIPVTIPAIAPAAVAAINASNGFFPEESMTVVTAAPNGKVLSTDRSGKSNILYVIYTPSAENVRVKILGERIPLTHGA